MFNIEISTFKRYYATMVITLTTSKQFIFYSVYHKRTSFNILLTDILKVL